MQSILLEHVSATGSDNGLEMGGNQFGDQNSRGDRVRMLSIVQNSRSVATIGFRPNPDPRFLKNGSELVDDAQYPMVTDAVHTFKVTLGTLLATM